MRNDPAIEAILAHAEALWSRYRDGDLLRYLHETFDPSLPAPEFTAFRVMQAEAGNAARGVICGVIQGAWRVDDEGARIDGTPVEFATTCAGVYYETPVLRAFVGDDGAIAYGERFGPTLSVRRVLRLEGPTLRTLQELWTSPQRRDP